MKKIFNLTLSLFLHFHSLFALSENHYGDCVPKRCGDQIVQYPFHIQNDQKPYCGYPGFGVSCSNDSFPIFNLSKDAYVIKNISYETQEFQVVNSAIIDGVAGRRDCFQSLHNLSMPPKDLINFSRNHGYIYVFPNCSEKVITEYGDKSVECGSLAVYRNDTKLKDLEEMCKDKAIAVPYYVEGQTKGKVMDMLQRGVLLQWKSYNCSACLESGGQCGFDEPNNQFNCFCPDRVHALHCPSPPPSQFVYSLQKPFCGQQGFEVTCNSKNYLIINLSNDTYAIQGIFYEFQSMHILNTAFIDATFNCTLGLHSFTLDENRFEFATTHNEVFYLQDCNNKVKNSIEEYKEESCISSNISRGNLIGIYAQGRNLSQFAGNCKKVVSVPYEGKNVTDIDGALRMGIQLKWKATNCRECAKSGGRCGYHNETSLQMQCFCPYGVHSHRCPNKGRTRLLVLIVLIGSSFGAVVLIAFIVICAKRRQQTKKFTALWTRGTVMNQNVEAFLKSYGSFAPKRYTYREIKKMTGNFKDKLGEGGYGAVYKGNQHDSRLVAVKKLKKLKGDGDDFINEVVSMGRTNHVNIVTLLGFCFEGNKRALVFEFLPNGSLEKFIYNSASSQSLPSDTLFSIAVGIAKGLDYLHRGCNTRILHFDIKPHNILLDEELRPKISDFGLARLCPPKDSLISMSEARGTVGYIAPEVFCRNFGGVSHKSDVYSYGMMLLDMVCGRNNVVAEAQRTSDMYFPDWIYRRLELRDEIENDGIIDDDQSKQLQRKLILVGLWCIQSYPSNRPPMNRVLEMLEGQLESLQVPPKPHLSSPSNPIFNSSENSLLSMGN